MQPYASYPASQLAGEEMDQGYQCIAELLNAEADEITLGPSTTLNFYTLAQAIRPSLNAGDELIVTNQDHEANIGSWRRLAEFGVIVKQWSINPATGELDLNDLEKLISSRTKLVCFSLCSNIVGTMNDAEAIIHMAHRVGALAVGDGVAYAPHRLVDVKQLDLDLYLFSTYKTFGTHVGVLWGKQHVLSQLACQGHYFNESRPRYRLNPTGPQHAQIAALAGVGQYFDTLYEHHFKQSEAISSSAATLHERATEVFNLIADHEKLLANRLLATVREIPSLKVIGQSDANSNCRAPTISVICQQHQPSELVKKLAEAKIAASSGHFYALRCIEALGIADSEQGVLRISLVHYNTLDEVDRLCQFLRLHCG